MIIGSHLRISAVTLDSGDGAPHHPLRVTSATGRRIGSASPTSAARSVVSKIKKAQTKLTILMPDAAIRLSGRIQAAALDRTRGRIGGRYAGAPVMTLITIGRKTGQRRSTAVIYGRDGDRLIVIGSNTGSERPPAWVLNLEAQPAAEVRVAGRHRHVTARLAHGEERARLWRQMSDLYLGFDIYTQRTDRDIKLFVLEPVTE
jgi:deazaflavin-dependent oxidoreductase (nitroreductase family)